MNQNQKLDNTEIVTENRAIKKIENFWYHNKWTVIVVVFFVCVAVVCTVQMFSKEKYDVSVLHGSKVHMNPEQREAFLSALEGILPSDYDKDGQSSVGMVDYQIFSEQERLVEVETEIDGVQTTLTEEMVSAHWNNDQRSSFLSAVQTGEYSLCFASPHVYELLTKDKNVVSKSFCLGDTDFYRYNEAVQVLPADTVVCLLIQFPMGTSGKDDIYARSVALYEAILAYDVQE